MSTLQVVETKRHFRRMEVQARRTRLQFPLGIAFSLLIGSVGGIGRAEEPKQVVPTVRSSIHALAHLEPRSGLVNVGARPGARILKIEVNEGDVVKAGDLLATLEGDDQAKLQLDLAVAQKKRALERRSRARRKAALERKQIDQSLELQQRALTTQVETLRKKNAAAQAVYAGMNAVGAVAKLPPKDQVELEAALYLLQSQTTKTQLELDELNVRKGLLADQRKLEDEELKDGGFEDEMLDRQVEIAGKALEQTRVHAPSPGTILSLNARPGEISSGSLVTMGDLGSIIARAEVDQADVGKLRVGDLARVIVIDDAVAGKITRIGSLVGLNQMRSIDPRAAQDIRVVHVTIVLDNPEPASRFIGMQVDVAIEPGSGIPPIAPNSASP